MKIAMISVGAMSLFMSFVAFAWAADTSTFTSAQVLTTLVILSVIQLAQFAFSVAVFFTTVKAKQYAADKAAVLLKYTDDQAEHTKQHGQIRFYMDGIYKEYDLAKATVLKATETQRILLEENTAKILLAIRDRRQL